MACCMPHSPSSKVQLLLEQKWAMPPGFAPAVLATFRLWLSERQAALLRPENADSAAITTVMEMLQTSTLAAEELVKQGCALPRLAKRCRAVQERAAALVEARASGTGHEYSLLPADIAACALSVQDIIPSPPAEVPLVKQQRDLDSTRALALTNLAPLLDAPPEAALLPALLDWIQRADTKRVTGTDQQILRVVEERLFGACAPALSRMALSDEEQTALESVVDE